MRQTLKQRIYDTIEDIGDDDSRPFEIFILSLIFLNVIALILETVHSVNAVMGPFFEIFNLVSVLIFTLEYLLRIWVCHLNPKYEGAFWGRMKYALTPLALIDLIAILPFYLPFTGLVDLRHLRSVRLLRLLKFLPYSRTLNLFQKVAWNKRQELSVTLVFLIFLLLFSSSLMYYAEHAAQPDNFSSIPAAMWWAIATLTTVGYGDVYPITVFGRMFASVIAVLGIGLFALPTGILGAAFVEEVENRRRQAEAEDKYCPHCGENINET